MPKLLFLVTEDWYFCSHRLNIARAAKAAGFEVVVATRVQNHGPAIEGEGFRLIPIRMRRRFGNPFEELLTLVELVRLYWREKPAIVHHVALKPTLFGSLAARLAGVPAIINAVAGLGFIFTSARTQARLLRPFIQTVLRLLLNNRRTTTLLQNDDDRRMLETLGIVDFRHVRLIRGSGIDIDHFHPLPEPSGEVTVALVARMLWDKGVHNLVEAVRLLRRRGLAVRLHLVGTPDPDNPASIPEAQLRAWDAEEGIDWLGFRDDVREVWAGAHIAVLPSRREGLPKSLLEAAACARPIVATDVPGCREVVTDGVNGFLVPARDIESLADAIARLVKDGALRRRFGEESRRRAVEEFRDELVIERHLELYHALLDPAARHRPLRILFLADNFPPETNAAATRVFERACYWVAWGHEVTVITSAPNFPTGRLFPGYRNRWYQSETMAGMKVVRVKTFITANEGVLLRTLDFASFMISALAAGLVQPRPDLVVATSPQFFCAVGGWLLAALRRLPFVFELGDLWPRSIVAVGAMKAGVLVRFLEWIELFLYRRAAAVVALTNAFKADLVRRAIPAAKIAMVRNGVDLPRYQPRPRDRGLAQAYDLEGKFVVGYVGTHGMAHGLMNVLDAAERLGDRPNLRFVLVGAGAERQMLIDEATRRGLGNVVFMPPQPKEAMPAVWSLLDVALVHLRNAQAFAEVIPSKIFEAMAMGLPLLLVAPDGESRRIVEEDRAGQWVPAGDPEALAEAVRALMDDPHRRRDYAQASLVAAPRHSREHQARQMIEALARVAAGQGNTMEAVPP